MYYKMCMRIIYILNNAIDYFMHYVVITSFSKAYININNITLSSYLRILNNIINASHILQALVSLWYQ